MLITIKDQPEKTFFINIWIYGKPRIRGILVSTIFNIKTP